MTTFEGHELDVYQGHVPPRLHLWGHCPGLGQCDQSWHEGGCEPFWQYVSADGYDISSNPYPEYDATEKRWWTGPDGPDQVWTRAKIGDEWRRS